MSELVHRYTITAYSEWETLDVEADCPDDEHAIDKARRYGSLHHIDKNFPAVIFAHVICNEERGPREVGTWEYRGTQVRPATSGMKGIGPIGQCRRIAPQFDVGQPTSRTAANYRGCVKTFCRNGYEQDRNQCIAGAIDS
jgi:hypothetical protein